MELPQLVQELIRFSFLRSEMKQIGDSGKPKLKFWQPWIDKDDSSKQPTPKQLPTTKWKRDRRTRPDYLRKSDPKLPEDISSTSENGSSTHTINGSPKNSSSNSPSSTPEITPSSPTNKTNGTDAPIDMTTKQRGQPPSYLQTINNPGYRSSYRPSVIAHNSYPPREDIPSGISMCDPIIDEHFRRSLGKDYVTVFCNNNVSKEAVPIKPAPKVNSTVIELMDGTGLSVDDHFAKALGDTWLKLNKKESDIQNGKSESQSVVTI